MSSFLCIRLDEEHAYRAVAFKRLDIKTHSQQDDLMNPLWEVSVEGSHITPLPHPEIDV
jgi:hypothetical protein